MGSGDEFDAFVREHSASLLRAAWLLAGDWATAEDLVQTTLLAVWQRWDRASRHGRQRGYAHAVLTTRFLDLRRLRRSSETPVASFTDSVGAADFADALFGSVDARVSIVSALAVLSTQQRSAVVLRYFLDLSERDTAVAMHCSTGTVKRHVYRSLERLRAQPGMAALLDGGPRDG